MAYREKSVSYGIYQGKYKEKGSTKNTGGLGEGLGYIAGNVGLRIMGSV